MQGRGPAGCTDVIEYIIMHLCKSIWILRSFQVMDWRRPLKYRVTSIVLKLYTKFERGYVASLM